MFKNTEKRQIIKSKVLLYSTWHYIQYPVRIFNILNIIMEKTMKKKA